MAFWKRIEWIGFPSYPYIVTPGQATGISFRVNDGRLVWDPWPRENRLVWSIDGVQTTPFQSPYEFDTKSGTYRDFHLQFDMPNHDVYIKIEVYKKDNATPDGYVDGYIYASMPIDPQDPTGFTGLIDEYAPWIFLGSAVVILIMAFNKSEGGSNGS